MSPRKKLPSMAVAKVSDAESAQALLRQAIDEHGSTRPLQLEKRRETLTLCASRVVETVRQLQLALKVTKERARKRIQDIKQNVSDATERTKAIEDAEVQAAQEVMQYSLAISNLMAQHGVMEGLSLLVDCMTVRERTTTRRGKVGYRRISMANYLEETLWFVKGIACFMRVAVHKPGEATEEYKNWLAIHEQVLQMEQVEAIIGEGGEDEGPGHHRATVELEVEDDEVFSDPERAVMEKQAKEEAEAGGE